MVPKGIRHLLFVILFLGGLAVPGRALGVMVGRPAPDFTLPSTLGKDISLSEFRGKKMVLIEFYAIDFGAT